MMKNVVHMSSQTLSRNPRSGCHSAPGVPISYDSCSKLPQAYY